MGNIYLSIWFVDLPTYSILNRILREDFSSYEYTTKDDNGIERNVVLPGTFSKEDPYRWHQFLQDEDSRQCGQHNSHQFGMLCETNLICIHLHLYTCEYVCACARAHACVYLHDSGFGQRDS